MDFSKLKNKLLIVLCITVFILPFYLITFTYASEDEVIEDGEEISFNTLDNAVLSYDLIIKENDTNKLYYIDIEPGYTYYISFDYNEYLRIAYSNETSIGSDIYNLTTFTNTGTYDSVINGDSFTYLFFDVSTPQNFTYTITKVKNKGISSAVSALVDNVGIGQIWNIFDISINYIVVVVLFAFGCYIIFRIIRKISRGKEGL